MQRLVHTKCTRHLDTQRYTRQHNTRRYSAVRDHSTQGGYGYVTPPYEVMRPVRVLYPAFKGTQLRSMAIGSSFIVGAFNGPQGPVLSAIGINSTLQLGSPSIAPKDFDIRVWPVEDSVVSLQSGRGHTIALTQSGNVHVWGSNNFGQCGAGVVSEAVPFSTLSTPVITSIAAGLDNTFLLTEEGVVLACGWAADGQSGTGDTNMLHTLTPVILPSRVTKLSSSCDTTLVLCEDGRVYGWGNNEYNQITPSDEMQCVSPRVIDIPCTVTELAAGGSFSLFVTDTGDVWSCGYGPGTGRTDTNQGLGKVDTLLKFSRVRASLDHAVGITLDNKVARWGRGHQNKLMCDSEEDILCPEGLDLEVVEVVCGVKRSGVLTKEFDKGFSRFGMVEDEDEED